MPQASQPEPKTHVVILHNDDETPMQVVTHILSLVFGLAMTQAIEKMLEATRADGYRVRSLVQQIVQSDLFLNK